MLEDDENQYIPFKLVTNEVEELLTKKPLKMKGIGLPDNFNQMFGSPTTEDLTSANNRHKSQKEAESIKKEQLKNKMYKNSRNQ